MLFVHPLEVEGEKNILISSTVFYFLFFSLTYSGINAGFPRGTAEKRFYKTGNCFK